MQDTRKRPFGQKLTHAFSSFTSGKTIRILSLLLLIIALPISVFLQRQQQETKQNAQAATGFVTRTGNSLYLNGAPFKLAGANIYWLGLTDTTPPSYPSTTQVDNVLASAYDMHATVIRSHTLGIGTGCGACIEPSLNTFNDQAFNSIDYAIQKAASYHMHLLIPLTDNYHYYHGGKHNFTDWRGLTNEDDFYTNTTVIQDFKNYISHVLNHVNKYTGVAYKDDPTIMAWETGNEIWTAPASWTEMIAQYIKSIAPNQLVADGHQAGSNVDLSTTDLQNEPDADMYTSHFYNACAYGSTTCYSFRTYISRVETSANLAKQYNKVYYVGEYDWTSISGSQTDLQNFVTTFESTTYNIAGDLYWSLFDNGDSGDQYTMHYPGDTTDMQQRNTILTNSASQINTFNATLAPTSTATSTPAPSNTGVTALDDSIQGTAQNQWNYAGGGWTHCTSCDETNPVVTYYNASQSWDSTSNDSVSVAFTGTQIQFHGVTGPAHGIGAVSIDGGAETNVDFYRSTKTGDVLLWTSPVLTYGSHTFTVRVTGSKNASSTGYTVPVDRVDIATTTPTATSVSPTPTPTLIPLDTTPPSVAITYPLNGAAVKHGSTVTITANDSDNVGVTQIQFLVNGTLLCSINNPPSLVSCNWSVPGRKGVTYTITARAYDAMGNASSQSIQVRSSR
jgi:mannan endo-1,4-beta-mannosidase